MQFVFLKCTSVFLSLLEVLKTNNCFTMLTYHYAFGLEDEHMENLAMDRLRNQP
jgi:hypothetical protein